MNGITSLYFHFPFCNRKCPYCHFFVLPNKQELKERFLKALLIEWEIRLPLIQEQTVVSLYFGGGTPALFPEGIEAVLKHARCLKLSRNCEVTVEVNPEDVTAELLSNLKAAGVNRLSFGVQSFDNALLKHLGRTHSAARAIEAVYAAEKAGFENITIDLMYELPYQTLQSWGTTLSETTKLPLTHLSLYNLVIEPKTPFYRKKKILKPLIPPEEVGLEMLEMACRSFEEKGLKQYEISAFAKEGYESSHNTGYWKGRPFLGLGPSAFSYWKGKRSRNAANLKTYQETLEKGLSPVDFEEKLPFPANLQELIAVRLRLFEGVNLEAFQEEFGPLPLSSKHSFKELEKDGYLQANASHLALTPKGRLFYDFVAEKVIA